MTRPKIIGLGAGGHAKVVLEILSLTKNFQVVGLLDSDPTLWGKKVLGIPVLGDDSLLSKLYRQNVRKAFIGLGCVKDMAPRAALFQKARRHGFHVASALHPKSIISSSVKMGEGTTVMAGAIINSSVTLGDNVLVNTGAIIEHDCTIASHVHIATGARLASTVNVQEGVHVGLGACIKECIHIGPGSVVAAGAAVVRDIPRNTIVAGVPARSLKNKGQGR